MLTAGVIDKKIGDKKGQRTSYRVKVTVYFYFVSLTVQLSITLANDQLDAQIFNTFITFLLLILRRMSNIWLETCTCRGL